MADSISRQHILEDLLALKKILQILANEDESHNPEFIQQLSEVWHNLSDDCIQIESDEKNIFTFVQKMESYPPNEDPSLGFYLREYVGKEWLPFPFMNILQRLHEERQQHPQESELNQWMTSLNTLISSLDSTTDLNV